MYLFYSIRSKIVFVLALDFYVYIQLDDYDIDTYIEHMHQVLYESTKKAKRILFWYRGSRKQCLYNLLTHGSSFISSPNLRWFYHHVIWASLLEMVRDIWQS
jgi:hypothetical protein